MAGMHKDREHSIECSKGSVKGSAHRQGMLLESTGRKQETRVNVQGVQHKSDAISEKVRPTFNNWVMSTRDLYKHGNYSFANGPRTQ